MIRAAGVDGGGSGTRALVVDGSGRELGAGEGPPGVIPDGDDAVDGAVAAVEEAVRAALRAAELDRPLDRPLDRLWCGLAGAGDEDRRRAVEAALRAGGLARRVTVGTDGRAALRDAFGAEGPGVVLLAGTGSIALGRTEDGRRIRVGGWGTVLGDEGSGYWIAFRGMRAVLRAHDGRTPATTLRDPVLAAADAERPRDLVAFAGRTSRASVAALAPVVLRAAEGGDAAACRIRDEAVAELAEMASAAADRAGGGDGGVEIVLGGGLLAPGRPLGDPVEAALRRRGRRVDRRPLRPERGAARLALDGA